MRERLIAVRERRAHLIARADTQRSEVFALFEQVDHVAVWFDRARAAGRELRANPAWIAAAVALLVLLRPRRAFRLAVSGYSLWRGWRQLRAMIDKWVPARSAGAQYPAH